MALAHPAWGWPEHPRPGPACTRLRKGMRKHLDLEFLLRGTGQGQGGDRSFQTHWGDPACGFAPAPTSVPSPTLHPSFSSQNFLFEVELPSPSASASRRRKSMAFAQTHMCPGPATEAMPCGHGSPRKKGAGPQDRDLF